MTAGTAYLVCAVLGALNTANAWRPFARDGRLSLLAYVTGMLTSELPLHTVAWQAIATIAFAFTGAFGSVTGLVGLAVSTVSWIVLASLHRSSQSSRHVLEAALREALGERYLDLIEGSPPTLAEQRITRRQIAFPNRAGRRRYCHDRDVPYGDAGARNRLDIWRRPGLPVDGRAPVLVEVHGGAWAMGRKEDDARPLLAHLAARGWVCVSINYRLSPAATWPEHIVDVKRALAWVRQHVAEYGGDPTFIALTGGSAGGHLSALAALTFDDSNFQPGFEQIDTRVQAAVPMYGLFDLTNRSGGTRSDTMEFLAKKVFKVARAEDTPRWEAASPLCQLRADSPPFLIVHGENDSFLPVEQARAFAAGMRSRSDAPVAYAELPRTQHGFDFFSSVRVHHTVRAVARFLTHIHSSHRSESVAEQSGHDVTEMPTHDAHYEPS